MKCLGGRELRGALRGYDELVNLVLDDCEEFLRGMSVLVICFPTVYIYVFLIGYVSTINNENQHYIFMM